MGWKRRLEVAVYRKIKPLTREYEQSELPNEVENLLPDQQRRQGMRILRSRTAAIIVTAALAGGGGVMVGGYVEERDNELAAMHSQQAEWEWRRDHDVCLAEHTERAEDDPDISSIVEDPQLFQCYDEQAVKVAKIHAEAGE